MTTVLRRFLGREILVATAFVFAAFLALFAFFDLINELGDLGKGSYRLQYVLLFVLLTVPSHIYELFPIAVLIGSLYALSHLSGTSEFTVMRTAGLSPLGVIAILARLGLVFSLLTFIVGEFIGPAAERTAKQLKLRATSSVVAQEFRTGLWVKDEGRFVNVREVRPDSVLAGLRIFEFDSEYRLTALNVADTAEYSEDRRWILRNVVQTKFNPDGVLVNSAPDFAWHSVLTPDMLSVLFVAPERMSAWNLYQYVRHLDENRQQTERFEIALWKKLIYPFAALVMMALALPFAYIHTRAGAVGVKVFAGIMLGIVFHMLNSLFSHVGLLQGWPPLYAAAMPSAIFLGAAWVMMWWVERR